MLTPLTLTLLVSFFVSFAVLEDPDGTLATVVSFIPFAAPMTMPPRIALGEASAVEIVGAFAVTLAAAAALVPLAARIYSGAVLRTGSAVKLRDAWRGARAALARGTSPASQPASARVAAPPSHKSLLRRRLAAGAGHERVDLPEVAATRSAIASSSPRACSIPPAAVVSWVLMRRTSSIAPSARSTSVRSAPASSPSPPRLGHQHARAGQRVGDLEREPRARPRGRRRRTACRR